MRQGYSFSLDGTVFACPEREWWSRGRKHWSFDLLDYFAVRRDEDVYVVHRVRDQWRVPRGMVIPLLYIAGYTPFELREWFMAISKPLVARTGANGSPPPDDSVFLKKYPTLFEYLTLSVWDDGSDRKASSILLVAEDGTFKAALLDKNVDASLWASGRTFTDALAALEARASDPGADWRKSRQSQQRKGR